MQMELLRIQVMDIHLSSWDKWSIFSYLSACIALFVIQPFHRPFPSGFAGNAAPSTPDLSALAPLRCQTSTITNYTCTIAVWDQLFLSTGAAYLFKLQVKGWRSGIIFIMDYCARSNPILHPKQFKAKTGSPTWNNSRQLSADFSLQFGKGT